MSDYFIKSDTLTDIADAVREANGETNTIKPVDMPSKIEEIYKKGCDYAKATSPAFVSTKCAPLCNMFTTEWESKTWYGVPTSQFSGDLIWTDRDNIYYSNSNKQYVLNKETNTWIDKIWSGFTIIYGGNIWTDGLNIYFSSGANQYVLNKATSTWEHKTWNGLTSFNGGDVWTDGDNIYCSYVEYDIYETRYFHYILNKETSTWEEKTWNGLTSFNANNIWTDGDNIYYSSYRTSYVLDKVTSTWSTKTWNYNTGVSSYYINGRNIWTDGNNIYCSDWSGGNNYYYILEKETSTWSVINYTGACPRGEYVWTDGKNIYYSYNPASSTNSQYQLKRKLTTKL